MSTEADAAGGLGARRRAGARQIKPKAVVAEADADFWNQDAFAEDDDDASFDENALSDKGEDIVDSDFDAPEDDDDEDGGDGGAGASGAGAGDARASRAPRRKKGKYVDPALQRGRKGGGDGGERPAKRAKTAPAQPPPAVERASLRRSTKVASARAESAREERDAETAARRARMREREALKVPERVLTHEEMLEEADRTAVSNAEDLKALLRLEEERKRLPPKKEQPSGPRMTVISRKEGTLVAFSEKDADVRAAMFPQCQPEKSPAKEVRASKEG